MTLSITTLPLSRVSRFICCYAEFRYAECHYEAELHYAGYRNDKCHYDEYRYAECRYTECRYAECRGAVQVTQWPMH
jgi:hypothetical protein